MEVEYTYNNYSKYDRNPLNIQKKGKRYIPNPKEELICDNCINQELINEKLRRQEELRKQENQNDIQDRLNKLKQEQINNKVQERIKLTEKVAKNMFPNNNKKDKLINENLKGTFFLNDPKILMNDYKKDNAINKYNKMQKLNNQIYQGTNPNVDDYYRNYVDNYQEPVKEDYNKLRSRKYDFKNYNKYLDNQIQEKNKLKYRKEHEDDERISNYLKNENENFQISQELENKKKQQLNQDFINSNNNLIYLKHKKLESEKLKNKNDEQISNQILQKQLDDEYKIKKYNDDLKKRELQQELEKQLKEKHRQKLLDEIETKGYVNNVNKFSECTCNGTGTCSVCKKNYPLNFLNPKRNFKSFSQKKYTINRNNSKGNYN